MCTGMTLSYHPCEHRTTHYSTKCNDSECLQISQFPITFVNGLCIECMGSDNNFHTGSIKSEDSTETDVTTDVRTIGDKLDTLIESCGTIAGVVKAETQRRSSITTDDMLVNFYHDTSLRNRHIHLSPSTMSTTDEQMETANWLTKAFKLFQEDHGEGFESHTRRLQDLVQQLKAEDSDRDSTDLLILDQTTLILALMNRILASKKRKGIFDAEFFVPAIFFFLGFFYAAWLDGKFNGCN